MLDRMILMVEYQEDEVDCFVKHSILPYVFARMIESDAITNGTDT